MDFLLALYFWFMIGLAVLAFLAGVAFIGRTLNGELKRQRAELLEQIREQRINAPVETIGQEILLTRKPLYFLEQ